MPLRAWRRGVEIQRPSFCESGMPSRARETSARRHSIRSRSRRPYARRGGLSPRFGCRAGRLPRRIEPCAARNRRKRERDRPGPLQLSAAQRQVRGATRSLAASSAPLAGCLGAQNPIIRTIACATRSRLREPSSTTVRVGAGTSISSQASRPRAPNGGGDLAVSGRGTPGGGPRLHGTDGPNKVGAARAARGSARTSWLTASGVQLQGLLPRGRTDRLDLVDGR